MELGIPLVRQLIQPHSCYTGAGEEYRGTAATTVSGHACVPWASVHQTEIQTVRHLELIDGSTGTTTAATPRPRRASCGTRRRGATPTTTR